MLTIDIDRDAFVQAKVAAGQAGITTSRIDPDPVFDIRLLDRYGNELRRMNTQDSKVQIDATDLSEGMYYLYVYSGKGTRPITHKIIVGH